MVLIPIATVRSVYVCVCVCACLCWMSVDVVLLLHVTYSRTIAPVATVFCWLYLTLNKIYLILFYLNVGVGCNVDLGYFFPVSQNKFLNKLSIDREFGTPWWSFDDDVMHPFFPLYFRYRVILVFSVFWQRSILPLSCTVPGLSYDFSTFNATKGLKFSITWIGEPLWYDHIRF